MPCRQASTYNGDAGSGSSSGGGYATEAECLQACKEGACCEGTTCTVKPQCQCQGTGKVFKGVGTTCTPNPCGCCCIDGVATNKNEQECAADGGTWKPQCVDQPPALVVLTLSMTGYSQYLQRSPTTTSPGTWNFDFSCVSATYTLTPSGSYSYAFNSSGSIVPSALFYPSGSISGGNNTCGCAVPLFGGGVIDAVESAVATRDGYTQASQINCNAGAVTSGNSWVFELVPAGISYNTFPRSASVPGFCSGQFSVTGSVYGPGNVQCGTFTIGNPLP